MKLYEYQAKAVFERLGLPKPQGQVVFNAKDLPQALKSLGKGPWAVKAQVLAGGRGKAGGVKLIKSLPEAQAFAKGLLGKQLVTHQAGAQGEKVMALLVEQCAPVIEREMY